MSKTIYFYGVMKASKTAQLLTMNYNYRKNGVTPIIVKPSTDNKKDMVTSRLGLKAKADYVVDPENVGGVATDIVYGNDSETPKVVLVDEAQFFQPDFIEELAIYCKREEVDLYAFGLLKDFHGRLFAGTRKWIECADSIREVKMTCEVCNRKATCNALERKDGMLVPETFESDENSSNIHIGDAEYHVYCQADMLNKYIEDKLIYKLAKEFGATY